MTSDKGFPKTPGLDAATKRLSRAYDNAEKRQRKQAARKRIEGAAPAMLAALQEHVAGNYGQPRGVTVPALDRAREAIAAATGGPTVGT